MKASVAPSSRKDLQANGVEGDGNEGDTQYGGEEGDGQARQAQQGIEFFYPGRIELHVFYPGVFRELGAHGLQGFGGLVARHHDEGVGKGIARQALDDVAEAFAGFQPLQRILARHEVHLARLHVLAQA